MKMEFPRDVNGHLVPAVVNTGASHVLVVPGTRIRVVDSNGQPVPGVACEVRLADGSTIEIASDADGLVEISARFVMRGTCEVSFPRVADDQWKVV
jgi:hypothetical protein